MLRHTLKSGGPRDNLTPITKDFEKSSIKAKGGPIVLQKVGGPRLPWPPSSKALFNMDFKKNICFFTKSVKLL